MPDAQAHGLRVVAVTDTHFHADFLAGHLELAEAAGTRTPATRGRSSSALVLRVVRIASVGLMALGQRCGGRKTSVSEECTTALMCSPACAIGAPTGLSVSRVGRLHTTSAATGLARSGERKSG